MEIVYKIKELAQEFLAPPRVEQDGNDVTIMFDYEKEDGNYGVTGIVFKECVKKNIILEKDLKTTDVFNAYNAIAEEKKSDWIKELGLDKAEKEYHHYKIYFDDFGLYEFLAQSFLKLGEL